VIPQEAVDTVGDKWCTAQFFQQLGLTVPHSWLPAEINPAQMKYPLFIKPRGGSAAKYTFKIRDARELAFFMDYVPQPIIQEFLPGPEITSDICCDFDGKLLSIVSRQRIEVRSGEVAKGVTVYHQAITDACRAIARALPAVGPITVQCIMKGDVPHFTEINARLGGGLPLGIAAGVDSPRLLLMSLAGLPVDSSPAYRTGVYMTRFDDSFFLSEDEIEQITSRHI
jgi:carbamoyl-phosphate synthase large subunit